MGQDQSALEQPLSDRRQPKEWHNLQKQSRTKVASSTRQRSSNSNPLYRSKSTKKVKLNQKSSKKKRNSFRLKQGDCDLTVRVATPPRGRTDSDRLNHSKSSKKSTPPSNTKRNRSKSKSRNSSKKKSSVKRSANGKSKSTPLTRSSTHRVMRYKSNSNTLNATVNQRQIVTRDGNGAVVRHRRDASDTRKIATPVPSSAVAKDNITDQFRETAMRLGNDDSSPEDESSSELLPRVVFVSLYHFYKSWDQVEFSILFNCLLCFNCKKKWLFPQCEEDTTDFRENHPMGKLNCEFSIIFLNTIKLKDKQMQVIWLLDDGETICNTPSAPMQLRERCHSDRTLLNSPRGNPQHSSSSLNVYNMNRSGSLINRNMVSQTSHLSTFRVHPKWFDFSAQLSRMIDPLTGTFYRPLILSPEWWRRKQSSMQYQSLDEHALSDSSSADVMSSVLGLRSLSELSSTSEFSNLSNTHSNSPQTHPLIFCDSGIEIIEEIESCKFRYRPVMELFLASNPTLVPMVLFDSSVYNKSVNTLRMFQNGGHLSSLSPQLSNTSLAYDVEASLASPMHTASPSSRDTIDATIPRARTLRVLPAIHSSASDNDMDTDESCDPSKLSLNVNFSHLQLGGKPTAAYGSGSCAYGGGNTTPGHTMTSMVGTPVISPEYNGEHLFQFRRESRKGLSIVGNFDNCATDECGFVYC